MSPKARSPTSSSDPGPPEQRDTIHAFHGEENYIENETLRGVSDALLLNHISDGTVEISAARRCTLWQEVQVTPSSMTIHFQTHGRPSAFPMPSSPRCRSQLLDRPIFMNGYEQILPGLC